MGIVILSRKYSLIAAMLMACPGAVLAADNLSGPITAYTYHVNGDIDIAYGGIQKHVLLKDFDPKASPNKPVRTHDVTLAGDGRTLVWVVDYDNCCTSYPIARAVVVYRDGKIAQTLMDSQMIWTWHLIGDGEQIAIETGPTHGDTGTWTLYDTQSGKKLEEAYTQDGKLPDWTDKP